MARKTLSTSAAKRKEAKQKKMSDQQNAKTIPSDRNDEQSKNVAPTITVVGVSVLPTTTEKQNDHPASFATVDGREHTWFIGDDEIPYGTPGARKMESDERRWLININLGIINKEEAKDISKMTEEEMGRRVRSIREVRDFVDFLVKEEDDDKAAATGGIAEKEEVDLE